MSALTGLLKLPVQLLETSNIILTTKDAVIGATPRDVVWTHRKTTLYRYRSTVLSGDSRSLADVGISAHLILGLDRSKLSGSNAYRSVTSPWPDMLNTRQANAFFGGSLSRQVVKMSLRGCPRHGTGGRNPR